MKNLKLINIKSLLLSTALLLPVCGAAQTVFDTYFTDYELGSVNGQHNWTDNSTPTTGWANIVEAGQGGAPASPSGTPHFLKLVRPDTTTTPWARQTYLSYADALRSGLVRFTYTMALDWGSNFTASQVIFGGSAMGSNGIKTGFHFGPTTGSTNRYIYVMDASGTYHYLDADPNSDGLTPISRNSFYRFDILLNIDTKQYTVTVYNTDNQKLDSITLTDWQRGAEEVMFNRIHVGMPGGSANDTLYVDHMRVVVPESGNLAIGMGALALLLVFSRRLRLAR